MRIGIDLDNTIISYDGVFAEIAGRYGIDVTDPEGAKHRLRSRLQKRDGGELLWQEIQGQVYGPELFKARLFAGVYRCLWRLKRLGHSIEVVSHKTKFGHGDATRTPLRTVAEQFLRDQGLFVNRSESIIDKLIFLDSRSEKIDYIAAGKFKFFIDDLPEVLDDAKIPAAVYKIGFSPHHSQQVSKMFRILGRDRERNYRTLERL